jgi:hypothetical protein
VLYGVMLDLLLLLLLLLLTVLCYAHVLQVNI